MCTDTPFQEASISVHFGIELTIGLVGEITPLDKGDAYPLVGAAVFT